MTFAIAAPTAAALESSTRHFVDDEFKQPRLLRKQLNLKTAIR
jgi:hypothetical protein